MVIGTQSAHGTSERALLAHYLVLPLAVTLAGSLLGLLLGRALAPFLGLVTDYYSFPAAPVEPTPLVALLSIMTPVTLVMAVNALVIRSALGRPTQELLRPQPAGGPGLPVRLDRLPFVSMFRLRQALRTPGSYLLIAAGTFLCILLLVFGLGMRSSMDTYLTRAEDELLFHDFYTLRFPDLAAVPPGGHEAVAVPLRVVGADGRPGESLTVLGVPSNDFNQESADNATIREFCDAQFGIEFPMAALSHVRGDQAIPLFRWLAAAGGGEPRWNFHKYLVGRDGRTVRGFATRVEPESPEMQGAIEAALARPAA